MIIKNIISIFATKLPNSVIGSTQHFDCCSLGSNTWLETVKKIKQKNMKNIFIDYYFNKIKKEIVYKTKFYFFLIFNKNKLKEIVCECYKKEPNKYTVQKLIGDLIECNVKLDTPIVYQRIEDSYFTERKCHNGDTIQPWETLKIKGFGYYSAIHFNENIKKGNLVKEGKLDKDEVGKCYYENELKPIDLTDDCVFEQYIDAQTGFVDSENDVFCITAHI